GELKLGSSVQFSSEVTITSADADNPAIFSKEVTLRGVENLAFNNILFDYVNTEGEPSYASYFEISKCTGISISNSKFDGDIGNSGEGFGLGLSIQYSSGIVVENNDFSSWRYAVAVGHSNQL